MLLGNPINLVNSKVINLFITVRKLLRKAVIKTFFLQFGQLFLTIILIFLQISLNFILKLILMVMIKFKLVNKISGYNFRCISLQKEIKSNCIIV